MQIIDIQERDYNNHIKKIIINNHAVNKKIISNSCYLKKKKIWKRKRYNMHHYVKKRVKKKPLAWALFVLERMF